MNKKEIEKEELNQISGGSIENLKPIRIKYKSALSHYYHLIFYLYLSKIYYLL